MKQAAKLYREGDSFALSMYCSGLAVERLLRAFRSTEETSFEGRHDLRVLFEANRLLQVNDDLHRRQGDGDEAIDRSMLQIQTAMQEVVVLREAFDHSPGRGNGEPRTVLGASGLQVHFMVQRRDDAPSTKDDVLSLLKTTRHLEMAPHV